MTALQAAVDPLDGVALVLGDDALLDVGVNLLIHEVLQFGQIIIIFAFFFAVFLQPLDVLPDGLQESL